MPRTMPAGIDLIAESVRTGLYSARETAEATLAAIAAAHELNAFVHVDPDAVLQQALRIDRRLMAGENLPLAGVPVGIKDVIAVEGQPLTLGSRLFAANVATADAVAVARLRHAGAVIIGMTNTSEFACKGVTTNPLYGPTRHPADHRLTPGGSSGGSAAAVAAGLVPLCLGTDSGGSARRPAAHSGIVGFKPSYGAVPNGPGLPGASFGINCIAPMTQRVSDARRAFDILAGAHPSDPDSCLGFLPDILGLADMTIGYTPKFGLKAEVDPVIAAAVAKAVEMLRQAGMRVIDKDPDWPENVDEAALMPLQHAALASLYGTAFRQNAGLFDPDIAVQIERGLGLPAMAVTNALLLSKEIKRRLAATFETVDLLVGPTVPCFPWPLDQLGPAEIAGIPVAPRAHAVFTPFFNHAGVPAISIPLPMPAGCLPAGLQIVGPRGADYRILDFAVLAETLLEKGR